MVTEHVCALGPVAAVLLLTDGLPTSGITDPTQLKSALKSALSTGPPIKIHTFGYGSDHDAELLKDLADIGGGNYYAISTDSDVPTFFADALGGHVSVVVQNIAVDISTTRRDVQIEKIFTGLKIEEKEDGSWSVRSDDLYAEERKDIIVRLKIPPLTSPVEAEGLLHVQLSYFDIQEKQNVTNEAVVCVKRPETIVENQVADEDFLDQRLRVEVTDTIEQATSLANTGNLAGALRRVDTQLADVQENHRSEYANAVLSDLIETRSVVSDAEVRCLSLCLIWIRCCPMLKVYRSSHHSLYRMASSHGNQRGSSHFWSHIQCRSIDGAQQSVFPNTRVLSNTFSGINPPLSAASTSNGQEQESNYRLDSGSGFNPPRSQSSMNAP